MCGFLQFNINIFHDGTFRLYTFWSHLVFLYKTLRNDVCHYVLPYPLFVRFSVSTWFPVLPLNWKYTSRANIVGSDKYAKAVGQPWLPGRLMKFNVCILCHSLMRTLVEH